jgi:hypothetical protein
MGTLHGDLCLFMISRCIYLRMTKISYKDKEKFYLHGSVRRESMSIIVQQDSTIYSLLYFCKLLYMFRLVTPPITRSTFNCNYNI